MGNPKQNLKTLLDHSTDEDLLTTWAYLKGMSISGMKSEYEKRGATLNFITEKLMIRNLKNKISMIEKELDKRDVKYDKNL